MYTFSYRPSRVVGSRSLKTTEKIPA